MQRIGARCGGDAVGNTAAHSTSVEAQHEPGTLGCAAMHEREHAQRPMQTDKSRWNALEIRETRAPHQRAIGENPEVLIVLVVDLHCADFNQLGCTGRRTKHAARPKIWPNCAPVWSAAASSHLPNAMQTGEKA